MPTKNLRIRSNFLLDMQVPAWLSRLPDIARIILFAAIAGFSSVPSLHAQSAGLNGVVTDATGGVVPEAEIAVMNEETGLQRSVLSDGAGRYAFAQLPTRHLHARRSQGRLRIGHHRGCHVACQHERHQ